MMNEELIEKYKKRIDISELTFRRSGPLSESMIGLEYDDATKILIANMLEKVNEYVPAPSKDSKYRNEMLELRIWLFGMITILSGEMMQIGEYEFVPAHHGPTTYGPSLLPPAIRLNTKELMKNIFEQTVETMLKDVKEAYRLDGIDIETGNDLE